MPNTNADPALSGDAKGGLLLIGAAALALIVANSPAGPGYANLLHRAVGPLSIELWINDALMALFFFLVGLEVKRELLEGDLSHPGARILPVCSALGGMVVPALLYLLVTHGAAGATRGWAVPAATDIAFAQALLLIAGRGAPPSLRLFLTTLAIIDDIGAVAIIAIAYTAAIDWTMLAAAAAILAVMTLLARRRIDAAWPYALLAVLLWVAMFRSGVHATVAGVLAALTIPSQPGRCGGDSLLHRLEAGLQPWVALLILPLFGFANAGLALGDIGPDDLSAPIPLGVAIGLFLGKPIGVGGGIVLALALRARRPAGTTNTQLAAVALLAGIGFTMSLFIGGLAFDDAHAREQVKLGVLAGSIASALAGAIVLKLGSVLQSQRR